MDEYRALMADPDAAQQHRRIKRGVVAGYIHELSARHNGAAHDAEQEAQPLHDARAELQER